MNGNFSKMSKKDYEEMLEKKVETSKRNNEAIREAKRSEEFAKEFQKNHGQIFDRFESNIDRLIDLVKNI